MCGRVCTAHARRRPCRCKTFRVSTSDLTLVTNCRSRGAARAGHSPARAKGLVILSASVSVQPFAGLVPLPAAPYASRHAPRGISPGHAHPLWGNDRTRPRTPNEKPRRTTQLTIPTITTTATPSLRPPSLPEEEVCAAVQNAQNASLTSIQRPITIMSPLGPRTRG